MYDQPNSYPTAIVIFTLTQPFIRTPILTLTLTGTVTCKVVGYLTVTLALILNLTITLNLTLTINSCVKPVQ